MTLILLRHETRLMKFAGSRVNAIGLATLVPHDRLRAIAFLRHRIPTDLRMPSPFGSRKRRALLALRCLWSLHVLIAALGLWPSAYHIHTFLSHLCVCTTEYEFVLRSMSLNYGVWACTTDFAFVLRSMSLHYGVWVYTTEKHVSATVFFLIVFS